MKLGATLMLGCWGFIVPIAYNVHAQLSVPWYTVDGGGGASVGVNYSITGTIGQHDAGTTMWGTNFSVVGGFWSFLAAGQIQFPPIAQTVAATGVTSNAATFNAAVNPANLPTIVFFQWGTTVSYGNYSGTNLLAATNTQLSVAKLVSGLPPASTIHFRVVAVSGAGTSYGDDFTLTTFSAAGGTWIPLANLPPGGSAPGHMHLLPDGTVLAVDANAPFGPDWYRLTPDIHGSYANGTWSTIAPMHNRRLDFGSAVLRDGRLFVAGGEYGNGSRTAEVYDPSTDVWTVISIPPELIDVKFVDCHTETLPNGSIIIAPVYPETTNGTVIFDPVSNTLSAGPSCVGRADLSFSCQCEANWAKLPDDSILTIDFASTNSERYIPSLNKWIKDADLPVEIYSQGEYGAGLLLPNGKGFFLGGTTNTLLYTPSGTTNFGTWQAGPPFPDNQCASDAPAAMLANGKTLCAVEPFDPNDAYASPVSFYEYDYASNNFTRVNAPGGGLTFPGPVWPTLMLDLPDGNVLFACRQPQMYIYKPAGAPLAAGKPTISSITTNSDPSYHLTGTKLNGLSSGGAYGDDEQVNSNYPLVRLTNSAGNVYYCRTYNWSHTGVMTGNTPVSTEFTVPEGLPLATYGLVVVANGIASDPVSFVTGTALQITPVTAYAATGYIAGPFSPALQNYSLTNIGSSPLTWSVSSVPWLDVSLSGGLLAPGATSTVFVTPNTNANSLPFGNYQATLWFTNLSGGLVQHRSTSLQVSPILQNGGMESYDSQFYLPIGWTLVTGDPNYDGVYLVDWGAFPHSGAAEMVFGGPGINGLLRQSLRTEPGRLYLLSLWFSADGVQPSYFGISWSGSYIYQITNSPDTGGWTNLQFLVTASSTNTVLDLVGRDDNSYLGVDDVSVVPVPVPSIQNVVGSGGAIEFTWTGLAGAHYQVEYSTNLSQSLWLGAGSAVLATNSMVQWAGTIGPDPRRFYRVRIVP